MENNNTDSTKNEKSGDGGFSFLLFRIIVVALLLGMLLLFRFLMPDTFKAAEKAYDGAFGVDVTASSYIYADDA